MVWNLQIVSHGGNLIYFVRPYGRKEINRTMPYFVLRTLMAVMKWYGLPVLPKLLSTKSITYKIIQDCDELSPPRYFQWIKYLRMCIALTLPNGWILSLWIYTVSFSIHLY